MITPEGFEPRSDGLEILRDLLLYPARHDSCATQWLDEMGLAMLSKISLLRDLEIPRLNRLEICAAVEVQLVQYMNRRVRRTYLCGRDRGPGWHCRRGDQ